MLIALLPPQCSRVSIKSDFQALSNSLSVAETYCDHSHGSPAHGVGFYRGQRASLAVYPVRSETARFGAGGEDEMARRVEVKCARDRFRRHMADRSQLPSGVSCKARNAVVTSIAYIQEAPRRCEVNLGAGIARSEAAR